MTDSLPASLRPCPNCAAPPLGRWCHVCGEKRLQPGDRSLGHLLRQGFGELTSLEGKWLPSFARLLLHPGRLSRAYLDGQRQRYLKPITLFLLVNLLFFITSPLSDFNLSLQDQLAHQPYRQSAQAWVEQRLASGTESYEAFAQRYRDTGTDVAKSLVIWHVPWLALALLLVFPDRRLYYAEHVVVALHAMALLLVLAVLLGQTLPPLVQALALAPSVLRWAPLLLMLLFLLQLYRGLRLVYGVGPLRALLSLPLLLAGLVLAHLSYRAVQFSVTMLLLD